MADLDTGTEEFLARVEDGVAVLTLNRPERRNALTEPMLGALAATLRAIEADDDVGCVVLTGAGGAFCAGGDVKAMAEGDGNARPFDAASSASGPATARPPGGCTGCPSRRSRRFPGRRPAPGWRSRWPATCATPRRAPS